MAGSKAAARDITTVQTMLLRPSPITGSAAT